MLMIVDAFERGSSMGHIHPGEKRTPHVSALDPRRFKLAITLLKPTLHQQNSPRSIHNQPENIKEAQQPIIMSLLTSIVLIVLFPTAVTIFANKYCFKARTAKGSSITPFWTWLSQTNS